MTMTASDFLSRSASRLEANGFAAERGAAFPMGDLSADLFARKSGRSLGVFFPYDDYYFFHDFSGRERETRVEMEALHEKARSYVNSLYRFPRWMRYRVPNVNTVAVSAGGFGIDCERYAHSIRRPAVGGEIHSVFLVDLLNRRMVSTGMEVTAAEMVAITFKQVNPHNRAHGLLMQLCAEFFGGGTAG
ncbi:MAG TPA: hypothetical protein PKY31_14355 [Spirochaetota bacterium]|nr:hypothetical protein [Spirochaetota bacterium]